MAHLTLTCEILVLLAVAREPWRYPIIVHAATDVIVGSLEPPLFHVAARRDVNCPVIRGEFHRARPWGTLRGVGKAETERENAARRRMMNGGVMVVSRAKPKYEWNGEEKYERKTARLEQGGRLGVACDSWFINVLSKKPLSPRGLPCVIPPALRPSSGCPPPFSFVYNHRHRPPSGGNRTAISEVANAICFCRYTAWNPTSILSRPALWKMRALVGPTFLGKEIYEPRPLIVPSRRDFLFTVKHSAREKIWYAWSPSDVASYARLQREFCTVVLQKFL